MTDDDAAGDGSPAAFMTDDAFARADPPQYSVTLWPHQSMTRGGFRWFIGVLAAGLAFPLLSVWGTPVAWFLAPFLLAALGLVAALIRLNQRQRRLSETVRVWSDLITVERREPTGRVLRWAANPYWVRLELKDTATVPQYLTLAGAGRRIELGAFLTVDERVALAGEIRETLARAASAQEVQR